MKNLLIMPTHQLLVLRESDITFNRASALPRSSIVRLDCVLWIHQRRTTMANGEFADFRFLVLAGLELALE